MPTVYFPALWPQRVRRFSIEPGDRELAGNVIKVRRTLTESNAIRMYTTHVFN